MDNIGRLWTIPVRADFSTFCHSLFHHRSTAGAGLFTCRLSTEITESVTQIAKLHRRNYTGVDNPVDKIPVLPVGVRAADGSGTDV